MFLGDIVTELELNKNLKVLWDHLRRSRPFWHQRSSIVNHTMTHKGDKPSISDIPTNKRNNKTFVYPPCTL